MSDKHFEARCAGSTDPNKLAGSLLRAIEDGKTTSILCIGANAIQQAIKAVIIARGSLTQRDADLVCRPSFSTVVIDTSSDEAGQDYTAIRFRLEVL